MPDPQSSNNSTNFLMELERIIVSRKESDPAESYTASLLKGPLNRALQKVGEEAVEYILEGMGTNKEKTISEGADLIYHFIVSLHALGLSLNDISSELNKRHNK